MADWICPAGVRNCRVCPRPPRVSADAAAARRRKKRREVARQAKRLAEKKRQAAARKRRRQRKEAKAKAERQAALKRLEDPAPDILRLMGATSDMYARSVERVWIEMQREPLITANGSH